MTQLRIIRNVASSLNAVRATRPLAAAPVQACSRALHSRPATTPSPRPLAHFAAPRASVSRAPSQHICRHYATATPIDYGKTFDKILIANRGEIACRVIRTAKKMGIKTVAIYSDADVNSLHVRLADEAVRVGPAPTSKSYLNIPAILEAIKKTGAQAVHPGYGFLSENFAFVRALDAAGVAFIGPAEKSMYGMGDKIQSKIIAKKAGVNCIPGFDGVIENVEHAVEIANKIGYPVMVKASAGGGGKGMRVARNNAQVKDAYRLSKAEALSSFGDDRLLIEKFVENPRHIEIQIIGDQHGNVYYLPERECSIQRRNQKVIEEAPSVHLDPATRKAMGEQAVALAKNVGYYSAGTCEFLVDQDKNFYFLEMNTRLQVEHPITEYITSLDLVECMIRVAAGQVLPFQQSDLKFKGWAVESRVYAEDPEKYLPSIGRLQKYVEPRDPDAEREGLYYKEQGDDPSAISRVRCDSGIVEGSEISMYYDPMICKLCTYGETRDQALDMMEKALDSYVIKGVTHNVPLLRAVIDHPRFRSGKISTKFLPEEYPEGFKGRVLSNDDFRELYSVIGLAFAKRDLRAKTFIEGGADSVTATPKKWDLVVTVNNNTETTKKITIEKVNDTTVKATLEGQKPVVVSADWSIGTPLINAVFKEGATTPNKELTVQYLDTLPLGMRVQFCGSKYDVTVKTPAQQELSKHMIPKAKIDLTRMILSPMPGTVVSLSVKEGDVVAEGSEVAVVEAMKMQNVLAAPRVGKIKKIYVQQGASVAADEILVEFFEEEKEAEKKK
ncbi:hypothetical protein HK102_008735 [Quaeritorhiza haematococci]|nr:hypothetical protein HK102_008735 [Quaeritorhiza haematococci]